MLVQCDICSKPYKPYTGDFLKCFECNQAQSHKIIKTLIRKPKIIQRKCTTHLDRKSKEKIATYIVKTHGVLYETYRDSIPFIKDELGFTIDFSGIRSIVNMDYFRKMAFDE
tara:strand:+ start:1174 stop:1509 length:336 start_codon:yes stop_codon:yes gene_type:complete